MAPQSLAALAFLLASASVLAARGADAAIAGFEIRHRFSDRMREWADAHGIAGGQWPEKRTPQFYASLAFHDRAALRGRQLAGAANFSELALSNGNITFFDINLESLYYAVVKLGTPAKEFLVALDTENGFFWVPCDCLQCAPTSDPSYGTNVTFNTYSPRNSTTSRRVLCSDGLCGDTCPGSNASCPYAVDYLYANTSSAGTLVVDALYLTTEAAAAAPKQVKAPVVFGCGQNQRGLLLQNFAPNGVLGLGLGKLSVPSALAGQGLVPDSFSMCFGDDGVGRLRFGDKGGEGQRQTSLNTDGSSSYNISLTGIAVGKVAIPASFSAIVDTGVALTYLTDPMYTNLTNTFNAQIKLPRKPDPGKTFDFCYDVSGSSNPGLSVYFKAVGGGLLPLNFPLFAVEDTTYCLGVLQFDSMNIIGGGEIKLCTENFLLGLRVVFDRENLVFGWEDFDCYSNSSPAPASSPIPAPAEAPAAESPTAPPAPPPASPPPLPSPPPPNHGHSLRLNTARTILLTVSLIAVAII